jgi:hypothetical protein
MRLWGELASGDVSAFMGFINDEEKWHIQLGTLGPFPHGGVVVHMSLVCAMLEIVYRSGTAYAPVDRPKMVTLKWAVASDEVSQFEGS